MNAKLIANKIQASHKQNYTNHGTDYGFKTTVLKSRSKKEGKKLNIDATNEPLKKSLQKNERAINHYLKNLSKITRLLFCFKTI